MFDLDNQSRIGEQMLAAGIKRPCRWKNWKVIYAKKSNNKLIGDKSATSL
jgi:hypothetical protein